MLRTAMRLPPWRALGPVAALALVLLLYYHPVVVLGKTFLTAGQAAGALTSGPYPMERNTLRQVMDPGATAWSEEPYTFLAGRLLRMGQLPLWNPYHGLGAPLLAHMEGAPFYPLKIFAYLLPFEVGWDLYIFSRLLVAAALTYAFARLVGLSLAAGLLAGTAFVLSGPLVLDYNIFSLGAIAFMPGQFLCLEAYAQSGRHRWLALFGLATAAGFSAGSPEASILATAAASLYYLAVVAGRAAGDRNRWRGVSLRGIRSLAIGAVLSALFSAFQLVPFLETMAVDTVSHRGGEGLAYWEWYNWALPVALPDLYGATDFVRLLGLGIVALGLAALGAMRPLDGMRSRAWCLAALAVVGLAKIFGFVGVQWLGALPGFNNVIFPRWSPAVVAFAVAVLAAMGLDRLRDPRTRWPNLLPPLALVLAYCVAAWPTSKPLEALLLHPVAGVVLAGFLVVALLVLGARYRPRLALVASLLPIPLVAGWSYVTLAPKELPPRLFPYSDPPYMEWIRSRTEPADRVLSLDGVLKPSVSSAFGVPNLGMQSAIYPPRVAQLARRLEPGFEGGEDHFRIPTRRTRDHVPAIWESKVLNLLGVRYLVTRLELESTSLQEALLVKTQRSVAEKRCFATGPATYKIADTIKDLLFFHPPCIVEHTFEVPDDALALEFSLGIDPAVWTPEKGDGIRFRLSVQAPEGEALTVDEYLDPKANAADRRWSFQRVPLRGLRGREVLLRLETDPGPRGDGGWDWGGWADLGLTAESDDDPITRRWRREYADDAKIYRNTGALPRVFVVGEARLVNSGEEALLAINQSGFDPRREVIFDREGAWPPAAAAQVQEPAEPFPDPQVTLYEPARVRLATSTPRDGYLVLSDVFYPGWRAMLDGRETPIYQGDYLLRVIELPAGEHQVEFLYEPLTVKLGAGLTLGTGVVLLLLWVRSSWKRRPSGPTDPGSTR